MVVRFACDVATSDLFVPVVCAYHLSYTHRYIPSMFQVPKGKVNKSKMLTAEKEIRYTAKQEKIV